MPLQGSGEALEQGAREVERAGTSEVELSRGPSGGSTWANPSTLLAGGEGGAGRSGGDEGEGEAAPTSTGLHAGIEAEEVPVTAPGRAIAACHVGHVHGGVGEGEGAEVPRCIGELGGRQQHQQPTLPGRLQLQLPLGGGLQQLPLGGRPQEVLETSCGGQQQVAVGGRQQRGLSWTWVVHDQLAHMRQASRQ